MKTISLSLLSSLFVAVFFLPLSADAYIGPGMGAGAIATVIGILMSILLALFTILWYPLKRLFKKKKQLASPESTAEMTTRAK